MNYPVRFRLIVVAALLSTCAFTRSAFADSQSVSGSTCNGCGGYSFTATLTSPSAGNYHLVYSILDVSGAAANAQDWSLTLFNPGGTMTSVSSFTMSDGNQGSYMFDLGKADNGGDCNNNQQYALCVALKTGATASEIAAPGDKLTFTIDFTCPGCTEQSQWDFIGGGTIVGGKGDGKVYSISQNGTPTAVPEPSTPILLFCSLLAALGMLAIPRVRNIVLPHSGRHAIA